jgi:hypothetical protein
LPSSTLISNSLAGDVSEPKHLSGRLSCVLPIEKMRCVRDWRSGFVAGISYGYDVQSKSNVFTQVSGLAT